MFGIFKNSRTPCRQVKARISLIQLATLVIFSGFAMKESLQKNYSFLLLKNRTSRDSFPGTNK